jgi:hypothetical protein
MTSAQYLLIALLTAHLLGDFILQSDSDAQKKNRLLPGALLKHAVIIALFSYLLCGLRTLWQVPVLVAGTHLLVDILKTRVEPALDGFLSRLNREDSALSSWRLGIFLADQALHVLFILAIVKYIYPVGRPSLQPFWPARFNGVAPKILIVLSGAILAANVGNILIAILVEPFLSALKKSPNQSLPEKRGLDGGGKTIGKLERMLIYLFVLSGIPQGIGFLVAAKSIFRFGELKEAKNRMEAEYIIIGTLYSFIWGILIAEVVKRLLLMPALNLPIT